MRGNQNPSGSISRSSVGDRSVASRGAGDPTMVAKLAMPRMPVEWLDSGSWRLPSGKALAEFALQAGFLAPLLFRSDRFGKSSSKSSDAGSAAGTTQLGRKQIGKGVSR